MMCETSSGSTSRGEALPVDPSRRGAALQRYCRLLLIFRDKGIRFRSHMGVRWFVLKAILLAASVAMAVEEDAVVRAAGLIVLGYVLGTIAAGIRGYVAVRKVWVLQQQVLDWPQIEACAREPDL